jgi:hypothetical protein
MGVSFISPQRYDSIHGTGSFILNFSKAKPTRQRLPKRSTFLPVQT